MDTQEPARCARCGEPFGDEPRHRVTQKNAEFFYHTARSSEPHKACSDAAMEQFRKGGKITLVPPPEKPRDQKARHRKDHHKHHGKPVAPAAPAAP
jgi:hypothetical protein